MIRGVSTKQFLLDLYQESLDDNLFHGAAALGFYLTLAIFPAMILLMTIIPYLPIEQVDEAIMDLLSQALPDEASEMVQGVVSEVTDNRRGGLLSFSLLGTLWAASTGMHAVMMQMNITYNVEEARSFIHARAVALLLSILFGLMIIVAFSLIVLGGVMEDWLSDRFDFGTALMWFFSGFRWLTIIATLLLGLAMIYRYAPNIDRDFSFTSPGCIVGVILLILTSLGFSIYTSNFGDYDATYGSLGAMIILMLWLYSAGLVTLLGSEINAVLERYGSQAKQNDQNGAKSES